MMRIFKDLPAAPLGGPCGCESPSSLLWALFLFCLYTSEILELKLIRTASLEIKKLWG